MEFPVLLELPLPAPCRKIVTQFLREPHPTALLIGRLSFRRYRDNVNLGTFPTIPTLSVYGDEIRRIQDLYLPPYYRRNCITQSYSFDEESGECIKRRQNLSSYRGYRPNLEWID